MYEQHFGLKKPLFPAAAVGSDVFVGPQTAVVMAGLKKALAAQDAIATVSGPVGSGKTTLVIRALQAAGSKHIIARVGRMRLDSRDVLELLTDALGLQGLPNGTIQRFTAFRNRLNELQGNGTRVFVVVEDSLRLGADTIAELEALTAADAGESQGASIVLMGDEQLQDFLRDPLLARVRQRVRHRQTIAVLGAVELRGYLKHCFRLAGGDFDRILGTDAATLLHDLSGGIPRVANSLIDSVLRTAASQGLQQIPQQLLRDVAGEDCGLSAAEPRPVPIEKTAAAVRKSEVRTAARAIPIIKDLLPTPAVVARPVSSDAAIVSAEEKSASSSDTEVATLIEETVPNLTILAPELVESHDDVPDWELEPTLAELKPDLNALEQAMAVATGSKTEQYATPDQTSDNDKTPAKPAPDIVPEITLDQEIESRLEDCRIEKSEKSKTNASDSQIEKITAELAKTKSLEDMDDRMAETLFGGELDSIAAQFAKPPAVTESANDDIEAKVECEPTPMVASASTRLRTVQALNEANQVAPPSKDEPKAGSHSAIVTIASNEATGGSAPDSIENQIDTSITQTLKTLSIQALDSADDDEEEDQEEQSKGGFFSRFKRS